MVKVKVKVLHLTEGLRWAGMEAHVYNLLTGLAQRGDIEVECVTFHEGSLVKKLQEKGVKTVVCPRNRKIDSILFFKLVMYFLKSQPQILHLHGYLAIFYGIPASFLARVPLKVATFHAKGISLNEKRGYRRFDFYLWLAYLMIKMSCTYFIAVSEDVFRSHVKFRKIPPERMKVVHNGISIEDVKSHRSNITRKDLGISDSCFIVGMVGRVDENKGHIFLLKAAKKILSERKNAHFIIIGDGPLEMELKQFCRTKALDNYVHFLGFQENILDYLCLLDVMVIASMHEGVPYALLEAMANRVAIIATNVGGIPEVIQNGVNGLLIPPKDPEVIARSITRLLDNQTMRMRLSIAALKILNDRFSQATMVQSTIGIYRELELLHRLQSTRNVR